MKKVCFILILFIFSIAIKAQEEEPKGWLSTGTVSLNLSQVALSNWTQGGQNSLSYSLIGNFGAKYAANPWTFTTTMKLSYGRTKLGSAEYQTTDNEIFWDQILEYNFGSPVEVYASNVVRTVISDGFDYGVTPSVKIASFWDPGFLNQGLGAAYKGIKGMELRLGLGFKETFANNFAAKYSDDPAATELEKFKFETGIDFGATGEWAFEENLLYQTKLNMFGRFDDLAVWDVRWDNTLTAKITKVINVNLNILLIYDQKQSYKTQIKEALQLGISYTLF